MRLIDADVALQRFIKEAETSGKGCIHINTIKRLLQDIDTAYDVEKVVAELVELNRNYNDGINLYEEIAEIPTDDAIDIVKRGGVE